MRDFKKLDGMRVQSEDSYDEGWDGIDSGNGWPTWKDAAIFWLAVSVSVTIVSFGMLQFLRFVGWVQ